MFPDLRRHPSPRQLAQALDRLPEGERAIILRTWDCADHHYRHTKLPFDQAQLGALLERYPDKPKSLASFDRAHRKYPLLLPWPIKRGDKPPWIEDTPIDDQQVMLTRRDQIDVGQMFYLPPVEVEDELGTKRLARLIIDRSGAVRGALLSAAAMLSGFCLLDAMDGKLDGIIHWCAVLAEWQVIWH
jgi:hypothetical protein